MATFTAKVLADGQLPAVKGAIFTASVTTYIHNIRLGNPNVSVETSKIYINTSGSSRLYTGISLAQDESCFILDAPIQIEIGDVIEGVTTTPATVDYIITGVEQT